MADIFLSYAREDREKAERLAQALEEQGWSVWWDFKIRFGKEFRQAIQEALASARCVLVLWSSHSVDSDWVGREAADGLRRGILVPILIERVRIPLAFRDLQTADLTKWDGPRTAPAFRRLVKAIGEALGETTRPRKIAVLVMLAVLLSVLGWAAWRADLWGPAQPSAAEVLSAQYEIQQLAGLTSNIVHLGRGQESLFQAMDVFLSEPNEERWHRARRGFDRIAARLHQAEDRVSSLEGAFLVDRLSTYRSLVATLDTRSDILDELMSMEAAPNTPEELESLRSLTERYQLAHTELQLVEASLVDYLQERGLQGTSSDLQFVEEQGRTLAQHIETKWPRPGPRRVYDTLRTYRRQEPRIVPCSHLSHELCFNVRLKRSLVADVEVVWTSQFGSSLRHGPPSLKVSKRDYTVQRTDDLILLETSTELLADLVEVALATGWPA